MINPAPHTNGRSRARIWSQISLTPESSRFTIRSYTSASGRIRTCFDKGRLGWGGGVGRVRNMYSWSPVSAGDGLQESLGIPRCPDAQVPPIKRLARSADLICGFGIWRLNQLLVEIGCPGCRTCGCRWPIVCLRKNIDVEVDSSSSRLCRSRGDCILLPGRAICSNNLLKGCNLILNEEKRGRGTGGKRVPPRGLETGKRDLWNSKAALMKPDWL